MRSFFRAIFIFFCVCLTFLATPNDVYADNIYNQNAQIKTFVSDQNSEMSSFDGNENYYMAIQNNSNVQITNSGNKNNNFGNDVDSRNYIYDNLSKCFLICEKVACFNRISHNISPNLKNAIYPRAP